MTLLNVFVNVVFFSFLKCFRGSQVGKIPKKIRIKISSRMNGEKPCHFGSRFSTQNLVLLQKLH